MADLDGDDMCRCGAICTCGGEDWGEEYDMYDEADDLYGEPEAAVDPMRSPRGGKQSPKPKLRHRWRSAK